MPRVPVSLPHAYRLLNHGPVTLVSARAGDRANAMAAQWAMPLDYDPPVVAVVVDRATFTRQLIDARGEFALSIPEAAQAALVWQLGSRTGADADKLGDVTTFAGDAIDAPLIAGCLAWLECRVVRDAAHDALARDRDLIVAQVVAASADDRYVRDERVVLAGVRTLHHLGGGHFVASGERLDGR